MSLISLKSVKNYQGVNDVSSNPSFYTSSFREGLPIRKGQSVQLISFSMNMNGEIIINSLNDTIYIKQGRDPYTASNSQTRYLVKKITIPNGTYSKTELKSALQTAIRNMIIIPDFNNWSVIEKNDSNNEIVFSIQHTRVQFDIFTDYNENDYEVFDMYNRNGLITGYDTDNISIVGNKTISTGVSVVDFPYSSFTNNYKSALRFNFLHALLKSKRGVFGEGGKVSVIIPKIFDVDDFDFNVGATPLREWTYKIDIGGAGETTYSAGVVSNAFSWSLGSFYNMSPPKTFVFGQVSKLGLDYSSVGASNVPTWFDNSRQNQYIFIIDAPGITPTQPTLDFSTLGTVVRMEKLNEQSFTHSSQTSGQLWKNFTGFSDVNCAGAGTETVSFNPSLASTLTEFKGDITLGFRKYGRVSLGLSQDILVNKTRSLATFGVDNEYTKTIINKGSNSLGSATSINLYSDWAFEFLDLDTGANETDLCFKYNQVKGTPASTSWRTITNVKSTQDPTPNWKDFTYGTSNIKIEFILSTIGNITFNASHDKDGTKTNFIEVFSENTTYGNNPAGSLNVSSLLREVKYPLTPVIAFAPHDFLQGQPTILGAYADLKRNAQDLTDAGIISAPLLLADDITHSEELGATQKANTTKFTMNDVPASQIITGREPTGDEILQRDIINATMGLQNDANAGKSIGFNDPIYTQDPSGSPPPTQNLDGLEIKYNNTTPNIIVEIPELKTESYNSVNQEKNNAIAFLPSVEFATNQDTGLIHHQSQYDVETNINVPNDIVINQLTAKITDDTGKILTTQLSHPTEMVIQIKDTQRSLMMEQANMINEKVGLQKQVNQERKYIDMPNYTEK